VTKKICLKYLEQCVNLLYKILALVVGYFLIYMSAEIPGARSISSELLSALFLLLSVRARATLKKRNETTKRPDWGTSSLALG